MIMLVTMLSATKKMNVYTAAYSLLDSQKSLGCNAQCTGVLKMSCVNSSDVVRPIMLSVGDCNLKLK